MKKEEIQEYIELLCRKYNIKYQFTEKLKYASPMATDVETRTVMIYLPGFIEHLDELNKLYKINIKWAIDKSLKHELLHLKISEELEKRGIPLSEQRRAYFVIFEEFYVHKHAPSPFARKSHNSILIEASTPTGIHNLVTRLKEPEQFIGIILSLKEDEIKYLFKDYPELIDFLLKFKYLERTTVSIDSIITNARFLKLTIEKIK